MQPSQRQQDILNMWKNTDHNISINAVAGSGKTTLLLMLLELCENRTLFIAFNKSVQKEIQSKIEEKGLDQGKAMTMHSLGLLSLKTLGKKIVINSSKNWNLIKMLNRQNKELFRSLNSMEIPRINFSLIDLLDTSRIILNDNFNDLERYLGTNSKTLSEHPELPSLWEQMVELRDAMYEEKVLEIDFLDMIYIPVKKDLEIPLYASYLFIDECQDLNLVQHKLIDKLLDQETMKKWIAVGDRNQAIYGFSGASSKSFDMFSQRDNVVEMPLDICYRCPVKVVEKANAVFDIMFPAENAIEGIVANTSDIEKIKANSMVICRNTSPLFELYFQLLGLGKPCYINGNEIMGYLLKFLNPFMKDTIHSATVEMSYKVEELAVKANNRDEDKLKLYIYKENFSNFISLSKHMGKPMMKVSELVEQIKTLFQNKEEAIMLCTIHKSKGLESDVVYILNESTTIPSKFAVTEEQLSQEFNLKYVARTRAKKEMYFLNISNKQTEDLSALNN